MDKQFTASEVREKAKTFGAGDIYCMLHAYADMLAEREETLSVPMNLRVALDFADNPRPYHSLACPADTNGELYRALKVLAAAYRAAHSAQTQPPAASVPGVSAQAHENAQAALAAQPPIVFECGPKLTCPDGSEHDYSKWEQDGQCGTAVCSKCGHRAIDDAYWR